MEMNIPFYKELKPTSIKFLRMVNYRKFKRVEFELHPALNVFLGNNGSGKTSILDAISLLISSIFPLCEYQPRIRALLYELRNVKSYMKCVRGKFRTMHEDVSGIVGALTHYERTDTSERYKVVGLSVGRKLSTQQEFCINYTIAELASRYNEQVKMGHSIPTFAHYGSHRGAEQGDRKRFNRRKIDSTNPFAAYINALHPSLDFDAFLEWFSEEEAAELRMQRKDKSYKSMELSAVRSAIAKVFETSDIKIKDPRFEVNPKRFVLTNVSRDGEELELEFDQLSDGYRAMIALVADYARRMAIANQYSMLNPLEGDGILLIDEIDAHLHPKWQYRVIQDLRRTFPNVQLIVTTHSAEVVSSVSREHIYILDSVDGETVITHPKEQTEGDSPDYISNSVMQTPEAYRNTPAYQAFLRCLAFIQEDKVDTPEFFELKNQVVTHYGESHHITMTMEARLKGLENKKALMKKLRKS